MLGQISSILTFGLLSIPQRRGSVASAVFGIAGVVAVLVGVLSIGTGFRKVMEASGSPDTAIVLRTGADNEMVSNISREQTRIVAEAPGLATSSEGPLASAEAFVIIDLPKRTTNSSANVPLRGVDPPAMKVREKWQITQGRMFEWGKNEIVVGEGAHREFSGLNVGQTIKVGRSNWTVVGLFATKGGTDDSEIWADGKVLRDAYNRGDVSQSVMVRLKSAGSFQQFKDALTADTRLQVKVLRQTDYYVDQSRMMTQLITTLGYLIATLMAIGAVFGALNTMYTSVSARTREIATLRALGFGRSAIVVAVLLESVVLALVGGAIGAALAYVIFNGFHTTTMNWQSFSQVTFAFAVTRGLLLQGIIWATLIGLIGGLFPAVRAARLPLAGALREI
jgi:putative ABC transport system permease protein